MKFYPILVVVFLFAFNAQADNKSYLFKQDTIVLTMNDQNVLFYKHKLDKQDKIEDLSTLFGTDPDQILEVNRIADLSTLSQQKEIIIPVSEKSLVTEETYKYNKQQYIPVVYQVRAKDNLFRIARHYFYQSLDDLMARNKMKDFDLAIGEKIHVGWLSTIPKDFIDIEIASLVQSQVLELDTENLLVEPLVEIDEDENLVDEDISDIELDSAAMELEVPIIYIASQGKGMWDKKVRDNGKLLALHTKAKIGSTIELKNNMLNRTIKAKVIGRIPKNVYPDDISVLIGPAAAKSLGVIDSKFFVEIRYTE